MMSNRKTKEIMRNFAIKQALNYAEKDPEQNIPKLMNLVDRSCPDGWYEKQRAVIRNVIE